MPRRVVLDCDTGSDDAIAIMLAAARPELELLAVTAVWGNHAVRHTADNSRRTLDLIGRPDVPVHAGLGGPIDPPPAAEPAKASPERATLPLPAATTAVDPQHAIEWLVQAAREATDRFTLVATGSLSNVAAAIRADPEVVRAVDELVVMGGVMERGGALPDVETNIGNDPEAAERVLAAGFERVVLMPLDTTYRATVSAEQCGELQGGGGPAAAIAADLIEQRIERYRTLPALAGRTAAPVHDALTVAYLVDPTLVTLHPAVVTVHTGHSPTRGRTDITLEPAGAVHLALDPDALRFFDLLRASLESL
ncbi:nucleoside hydrolase [Aeromicrobium sp. NPDC092404]|uniref:nucleoside hydrolase n=1 Tax=Aeromicrobium sp. NPDC092404 TaxID=3154976 RepID=UPI00341336CA